MDTICISFPPVSMLSRDLSGPSASPLSLSLSGTCLHTHVTVPEMRSCRRGSLLVRGSSPVLPSDASSDGGRAIKFLWTQVKRRRRQAPSYEGTEISRMATVRTFCHVLEQGPGSPAKVD